jgi:uncharacterized membrane protein YgdD (TMEM256/DUF423 family)
MRTERLTTAILLGIILCLLAVIFGAFGAHALEDQLAATGRSDIYDLANRYQFYHGLGILVLSAISLQTGNNRTAIIAAWLLFSGTLVFSGSLYALAISNLGILGAVTPIGGSLLILGWAYYLFAIITEKEA